MNKEKKIAIVINVPIIGYAIKHLLDEYYDLSHADMFSTVEELKNVQNLDSYFMFISDSESVIMNYEFFLLRKQKTVLLNKSEGKHNQFFHLNINDNTDNIIDSFQTIISHINSNSVKDNNKEPLSTREVDVLKLITKGRINKEIADELYISLNTVLTHRKNITAKLGIKTVSGLTFYAMMNGYIEDDDF